MKPDAAFVENIMLRGLIKDLADALERELQHHYKKAGVKQLKTLKRELELVTNARRRLFRE